MSKFSDRNKARKEAFQKADAKPHIVREARRRRRIYNGAFGNSPAHIFNELVLGTNGRDRKVTKQEVAA